MDRRQWWMDRGEWRIDRREWRRIRLAWIGSGYRGSHPIPPPWLDRSPGAPQHQLIPDKGRDRRDATQLPLLTRFLQLYHNLIPPFRAIMDFR